MISGTDTVPGPTLRHRHLSSPRRKATASLALLLLGSLLAGCSSPRPALYPNSHYGDVGPAIAEADVDACLAMAEQHGHGTDKSGEVATSTAVGGAVGAASGSIVGAVFGSVGRGAATGALGGATAGLIRGLIRANEPEPVFKNFVDRCLRERGYEPIGWE